MLKFIFIVCTEPYKYEAMDTILNLGEAIINKGHQIVGIFFYGSGVYNLKGNRKLSDSIRNLTKKIQFFSENYNVKIAACSTWTSITGLKESDFIKNTCIEGLGGLSELITESDRVIFFGPGRWGIITSIIIICEDSPFGKNSTIESIRLAAGILALGDIESCKLILLGDAIYFLNKNSKPSALGMDSLEPIIKLIEFSEMEIYIIVEDLEAIGLKTEDLISYQHLKIVDFKEISKLIIDSDFCFKY